MKPSSLRIPSFCFALAVMASPVFADTLLLSGTAQQSCSLTNPVNGTLALDAGLKAWTTSSPATIVATNTSAGFFELTVRRGNEWSASPTGTPTTEFTVTPVIASGANANALFSNDPEDLARWAVLANAGVDNVQVRMTASASGPYKAGTHTVEVTVTCTPK